MNNAAQTLREAGIPCEDLGSHIIVLAGPKIVDFWPVADKWTVRGLSRSRNRGIDKLINYVKQQKELYENHQGHQQGA